VSFQVAVLKILAGHPEGRASLAELKHCMAVLTCSGADWSDRMKRLAARAPGLDIFTNGYVLRHPDGWQLTEEGRRFLTTIEAPPEARPAAVVPPSMRETTDQPANVIQLDHVRQRRRAA
jgi:hypothetical protein